MKERVRRTTVAGLVALASSLGGVNALEAQKDLLGPGAGFITVGASGIATETLDDWLSERSYPTFGQRAVTVGAGAYRVFPSGVMVSAEFNGLIVGDEAHGERQVGLGGGYGTLGVGYAVNLSRRARVYPRLGLGLGGLGLWSERPDSVDFGEALEGQTPADDRESVVSRDGVVVDLGAGAELLPLGRRGPLLGVRAGYLAGPFDSDWETSDAPVTGGPEASISGPYVRVLLGWAWK